MDVLVVKTAEGVYAVDNYCPHLGAGLETGFVCAQTITCPAHGLRFDLGSGRCVSQRRGRTPLLTTMRAWSRTAGFCWRYRPARARYRLTVRLDHQA